MHHGPLIAGTMLLLALVSASAAEERSVLYRANEWSVDLFGNDSIKTESFNALSGERFRHDIGLGEGGGLNYFATRHLGVGAELFSGNTRHSLVADGSLNLLLRAPLGDSPLAPYALAGAGRQFYPARFWHAQAGAGLEWRFSPNLSLFFDGRWVAGERGRNYGLGRGGARITF